MQPCAVLALDIGGTKIAAAIIELFVECEGCKSSSICGSVSEAQGASGVLSAVRDSSLRDESLMRCVPPRLIHAQAEPALSSMCSEPPSTPSASLTELAYKEEAQISVSQLEILKNLPGNSAAGVGVDTTPSRNAPVVATPLCLRSGYCDNPRCMASKGCVASDGTPTAATEFPLSDAPSASLTELGLDSYRVVCRMQVPTDAARGGAAVLDSICSLAREVKVRYEASPSALPIVACGVGTAGNVDKTTGAIASANSLMPGWGGQPLRAALEAACCVPCAVLNDVQAHAMGELTFGAARGTDDAIMIAVGTGIGGAIVADGQVVLGARGFAGAFGTTPCAVATRMNESGAYANNGSIEAVASGSGIEAVYTALTGMQLSGGEIAACAQTNEDARKAIQLAGTTLGEAIATWVKLLDPAVVVLGGSVAKAGELWRDAVDAAYATNMTPSDGDSGKAFAAPIVDGTLGGDAPLLGAAAFALSKM